MSARRTMVAGNWKMNGSRDEAVAWARAAVEHAAATENEIALFPPYPWLDAVAAITGDAVSLGAQACHPEASGAFTGAISAAMVVETGCRYVLCGHSERRHVFGETDAFVAASLARALSAGLEPVLCVGETREERDAGRTEAVLERQLSAGLDALSRPSAPLVIAYEPVWAIGTGTPATPKEADEAHTWIRARVAQDDPERAASVRILYGGSVNADNIESFLAVPDVDGALVGGAALDPVGFGRIARATPRGASQDA